MAPRYSRRTGDRIQYAFWLVFDADGQMRMQRGEPQLERGERGMSCITILPLAIFQTPTLKATITLAEPASADFVVDVQAGSNALREVWGVDVDLKVNGDE